MEKQHEYGSINHQGLWSSGCTTVNGCGTEISAGFVSMLLLLSISSYWQQLGLTVGKKLAIKKRKLSQLARKARRERVWSQQL